MENMGMLGPYGALVGYQAAIVSQYMKVVLGAAHAYADLLDPRPDLAVPARSVKVPYAWWW
jgi:hypothetical protein